jgi:hypothetical protein
MKIKTYTLYWTAEVSGYQTVEAFDEEDARSQFDPNPNISDLDDEPIYAELKEIKQNKKKVK